MLCNRRHCLQSICVGFICILLLGSLLEVSGQTATESMRARSHQTIAMGDRFVLALQKDGTLWAWFDDHTNYFGARWILTRKLPVQLGTSSNWVAVSASSENLLALRRDGTLWLGGSEGRTFKPPIQVGQQTNWTAIATADRWSYGLRKDGAVWELSGALLSELIPRNAASRLIHLESIPGPQGIHLAALGTDQTFWISGSVRWGYSEHRSPIYEVVLARVPEASNCVSFAICFSHTAVVLPNGTLWAWPNTGNRYEKDGSIKLAAVPKQVGKETNWVEVFAESFQMIGLKRDGSIWFWKHLFSSGNHDNRRNLSTMTSEKPQRIGTDTNWNSSVIGRDSDHYVMATRRDGTLWIWDQEQPNPVRVGDLSNWGPPTE